MGAGIFNPLFLGLDIDIILTVVHDASAHFDSNLPLHGTAGGVPIGPEDGQIGRAHV